MNQPYDYQRFAILYVDDEEKSLKYFSRAFPEMVRWQDGKAERTLDRGLDEKTWVDEYRTAGRDLGGNP